MSALAAFQVPDSFLSLLNFSVNFGIDNIEGLLEIGVKLQVIGGMTST